MGAVTDEPKASLPPSCLRLWPPVGDQEEPAGPGPGPCVFLGATLGFQRCGFSPPCHLSLPLVPLRALWPGVRSWPLTRGASGLWSVLRDRQAGLWPGSSSRPTAVLRRLDWGSFEDHASGLGLVRSGEPSDVHLAVSRGGCQGRSPTLKPCGAEYVRPPGVAWSGWEIQARVLVGAAAATLWSRVLRSPLRVGGRGESAVHTGVHARVPPADRRLRGPMDQGPRSRSSQPPPLETAVVTAGGAGPGLQSRVRGRACAAAWGGRCCGDGLLWAPGQGRGGGGVGGHSLRTPGLRADPSEFLLRKHQVRRNALLTRISASFGLSV